MKNLITTGLTITALLLAVPLGAQSLNGSRSSIDRQNRMAVAYGVTFIQTAQTLNSLVNSGLLLKVSATSHLDLHEVSFPYALSGVKLFLERLSTQYFNACREKLVVTSLARPIDRQPANAAANSVHPTGMAVDFRIPSSGRCRSWLESTLLSLEGTEVLDVTRERNPPHYHVAVFVESYNNYVASLAGASFDYVVRGGDTLSKIASKHGVTVAQLRTTNSLYGDLINIGQKLQIPSVGSRLVTSPSVNQSASLVPATHKVRKGETLWRISNRYGTSVAQLRMENGLRNDLLQVGQVLRISSQ